MKKYYLFVILITLVSRHLYAQINDGSLPLSWNLKLANKYKEVHLPPPNRQELYKQDEQELGGPYRFGIEQPVEITLEDFEQKQIEKGKLYQLAIISKGSTSLNVNFQRFVIQPGTQMWVYDPSNSYKLGGFTWRNVNKHQNFATLPLPVDHIIIEVFEPLNNIGSSEIIISGIVTGYRPLLSEKAGFGQSGACNVNINCEIATGWENERQAVVMLLTANNTRKCTGTLINNTAQDGTPYILTAKHCNTATNAIFMFNYQSLDCSIVDGPTNQVLQGCEIMSENAFSDFTLLKLDQNPLPDFNPFFAGWSRSNTPSPMSYCIHHPSGDIKKFSVDSNAVVSSGYVNQPDSLNNHWKVIDWDVGTTEAGSSGSPLFNAQHQITGQLHGGYAACNNNLSDYYGRFDVSWQYGNTPNTRLKEWLDPNNTDSISMPGMYFSTPFYNRDIKINQIIEPDAVICDSILSPRISIISWGSDTVSSITIQYGLGQELNEYTWTGNLVFLQQAIIQFPAIHVPSPTNYLFTVNVVAVNSMPDENHGNDSLNRAFERVVGNPFILQFTTDAYPQENSISIIDENGNQTFSAISFQPNQINEYNLCFRPACYKVTLTDSFGDGICCQYGQGMFILREKNGDYVAKFHLFTDTITFKFCTPIQYFTQELFKVYPNPAVETSTILINPDIQNDVLEFSVYDLNGKSIYQENISGAYFRTLNLLGLPGGIYILMLRNETTGKIWKEKLIVLN
ncbi:MAG: T9SS type A sorting domain-containing protein [Flavobacteriales bacterium]|nr:T9SS type A sorting domain-containing protein [Flavobacteriales bacterium]